MALSRYSQGAATTPLATTCGPRSSAPKTASPSVLTGAPHCASSSLAFRPRRKRPTRIFRNASWMRTRQRWSTFSPWSGARPVTRARPSTHSRRSGSRWRRISRSPSTVRSRHRRSDEATACRGADLVGRLRGARMGPPDGGGAGPRRGSSPRPYGTRGRTRGLLAGEPEEMANLLSRHGLELVGGFVPVVLHRPQARDSELASVERQAGLFAAAGAGVLVVAAVTGEEGYEESAGLEDDEWDELFATLAMLEEIGSRNGLSVVLHPHYGTEIESPEHVQRFLEGCDTGLCLDTGHSMVGGGDPVALTEAAAARIRHVHLKDVDRDLAERVLSGALPYEQAVRDGLYMPLGDGDVDVRRVLEVLDG